MSIHEECGVFGVIAPRTTDVGRLAYYGLYALQHRGQESWPYLYRSWPGSPAGSGEDQAQRRPGQRGGEAGGAGG